MSSARGVVDFFQGATFSLNVAKVQLNAWDHHLQDDRLTFFVLGFQHKNTAPGFQAGGEVDLNHVAGLFTRNNHVKVL